jgi:hypothetical protein
MSKPDVPNAMILPDSAHPIKPGNEDIGFSVALQQRFNCFVLDLAA